jgi:ribosome maturation factor RimP
MELIELKVGGHKNDVIIQITADKPSGGINIRECAILNKSLVAAIEQDNFLPPENFSLELSSPGLDRPLVTRKDFMRFKAQELYFWLNEPIAGKKEVQGILVEVGESSLTVDAPGNPKLVLPLSSIIKGLLVI